MKSRSDYQARSQRRAAEAAAHRRAQIEKLIEANGLKVVPVGNRGARRLVGVGIDLLVAAGAEISPADLVRHLPREAA